jgi:MSHA biogenesis protein MshI
VQGWLNRFPFTKKNRQQNILLGAAIRASGVVLAGFDRQPAKGGRPRLLFSEFRHCIEFPEQIAAFQELVEKRKLHGMRINLVLQPDEYQLLRAEAPPVEFAEMREAMRWRVKDMIEFSPDEASLDVFQVPPNRRQEKSSLIYIAVARRSLIEKKVNAVNEADLKVASVDIPELVLRNVLMLMPDTGQGVVVLRIGNRDGSTMVYREEALYLSRELNLGEEELYTTIPLSQWQDFLDLPQEGQNLLDHIVLEVQRSLDYYESNFGLSNPRNLVMLPVEHDNPILARYLGSMLGLEVEQLDVNQLMQIDDEPISRLHQRHCLGAIAAALRDWGERKE